MNVFKMLYVDMKIGVWKRVRYLIYAGVMFVCCWNFGVTAESYEIPIHQLSFVDCLAYIWQGGYPMIRSVSGDAIIIPAMWLLLMLFTLLMPIDYPAHSMELWGMQYVVRVDKKGWWLSKCLYTIIVNIWTFVVGWVTVFIYCLIKGVSISLINNEVWYENIFCDVTLREHLVLSECQNVVALFLCPLIAVNTMCLIQLLIIVWIHSLLAYVVSLVMLVISVYSNLFFLCGNYTMFIRSGWIDQDGIDFVKGIGYCIVISIIVILLGMKFIKKKDIITMRKENS